MSRLGDVIEIATLLLVELRGSESPTFSTQINHLSCIRTIIAQVLVDAPSFNSFRAISQTLTLVFAIDRPARIILRPFRWCRSVCDFAVRFAQSVEVVSGAVVAFVSGGTARNLGASQVNQQTTHMPALEPKLTKFSCEQRTIESDRN